MQIQVKTRQEHYRSFIEFIALDIQRERHLVNRRMLGVFFWCFFLPVMMSISVLLLVKMKILPRSLGVYLDWLVLILPVIYSIYVLSSEVLAQIPSALKKGGIATSLHQAEEEGEWRARVMDSMGREVKAHPQEWNWIVDSFKMDLEVMQYRTRYLTALAGAVFFLLMQGIDSLTGGEKVTWVHSPVMGWAETSSDLSQFVGLALFLILLYLSGGQTLQALKRYLNCAELLAREKSER